MKKLIIAILIGLLAYPPFAFAGGIFDSKTFPGLEPETYKSCFFYWSQHDARMYGDGSEMIDGSGGRNFCEQGTGANQATEYATYLHFETDDFMSQEVIASHTGLTPANNRSSFAAGSLWAAWDGIDLSAYASSDYEIIFEDSAGKRKKAKLTSTLGGGETWGATLIVNGTFDSDIANWTDNSDPGNSIAWNAGGWMDFTADGATYAVADQQMANTVVGKRFKFMGTFTVDSYRIHIGSALGDSAYYYNTSASGTVTTYYTAEAAGHWLRIRKYPAGISTTDNVSVQELTDCSTQGVHTGAWVEETGVDLNDIVSITIRKSAFSVTGDLTLVSVAKPDDGQPASGQYFIAKHDDGGVYSYGLKLETTGKVSFIVSDDGSTIKGITTDSAVFTNGVQAKPKKIAGVYDASGSVAYIYINGDIVATSNLGGGGVGASIYDGAMAFKIGAEETGHYFAGNHYVDIAFAREVTAAEIKNMYHPLK